MDKIELNKEIEALRDLIQRQAAKIDELSERIEQLAGKDTNDSSELAAHPN